MKLLIYVHDWAPTLGGIQTITQVLARGLAAADHLRVDVTLVTMTAADGMNDSALPYRVVRRPGKIDLLRLLHQADVVHVAGPCLTPLVFCLLLRKPVAVEHHGLNAICPNGHLLYQLNQSVCPGHFMAARHLECLRCNAAEGRLHSLRMWMLTFLRRACCMRVSANVVPTNWLRGELHLPRVQTISHGMPAPRVTNTARPGNDSGHFLFVGRLVSAKGVETLLRAAGQLKRTGTTFRLHLVGDGPERAALEALAVQSGISGDVAFYGSLPNEALERVWQQSTALVAPSLGGEVFGLVVAEAMLRGLPVIVTAGGALAEVAGGAALTFPVGDASRLAECMGHLVRNPDMAAQMGATGRARARQLFTEQPMLRAHILLYSRIASTRGDRPAG